MEKKRWRGNTAMKILMTGLLVLSLIVSMLSLVAIAFLESHNVYTQEKAVTWKNYEELLLDRYSVYAIANYVNGNTAKLDELMQTSFRYGIIETDDWENVDLNDKSQYLIHNMDQAIDRSSVNVYSCTWNEYTSFDYDMSLFGYAFVDNPLVEVQMPIEGYYYNWTNQRFYVKVDGKLYAYNSDILVNVSGENVSVVDADVEQYTEQTEAIAAEDFSDILDNTFLNEDNTDWREDVNLELWLADQDLRLRTSDVVVVDDMSLQKQGELLKDAALGYIEAGKMNVPLQTASTGSDYYIVSYTDMEALATKADVALQGAGQKDLLAQMNVLIDYAYAYRYIVLASFIGSFLIAIAAFIFLMLASGHKNGKEELCRHPWDALWLDVHAAIVFVTEACLLGIAGYVFFDLFQPWEHVFGWVVAFFCMTVGILLALEWCMSLALWWKLGRWWQHTLCYVLWSKIKGIFRKIRNGCTLIVQNMNFLWKVGCVLLAILVVEVLMACVVQDGVVLVSLIGEKLILYPIILFACIQMNQLKEGAQKLANGDLQEKIDTKKMYWEFKQHGETLNSIGDGINAAVNERMKSERFKTELITNVSHDIKTPLTSIINYVDLLGKEKLDNAKAVEYLEVLHRQSARLKKLIEDLIEASKASTGSLKVNMELCDAQVTLVQTIGEYEEKLLGSQIELIVSEPTEKMMIQADSRHLWRVFDNLMNNICKYAQPGTRAYVNLEKAGSHAQVTFRNISAEALNISSEELMERFVRGDRSRNKEGNGLGLSIARSLVELMNGSLELIVDGDLFKVVLSFPVCECDK